MLVYEWSDIMATKSIYKSVSIKSRPLGNGLVSALENAKNKKAKPVVISKKVVDIKKDKIREIFGN